jgi:hypothetical protein
MPHAIIADTPKIQDDMLALMDGIRQEAQNQYTKKLVSGFYRSQEIGDNSFYFVGSDYWSWKKSLLPAKMTPNLLTLGANFDGSVFVNPICFTVYDEKILDLVKTKILKTGISVSLDFNLMKLDERFKGIH